jgi:hypothetical protein
VLRGTSVQPCICVHLALRLGRQKPSPHGFLRSQGVVPLSGPEAQEQREKKQARDEKRDVQRLREKRFYTGRFTAPSR